MVTLSAQQEQAVRSIRDWYAIERNGYTGKNFYLGGYAGTGKSTCLPAIIDSLGLDPADIAFIAPTAKAAMVMSQKLRDKKINQTATTIHSAIYRPKMLPAEVIQMEMTAAQEAKAQAIAEGASKQVIDALEQKFKILQKDFDAAIADDQNPHFQLNPDAKIQEKRLIIADEGSMIGQAISEDLMSFGVPIFVMGDPGQLPPVGDTAGLTAGDPDFFLTEIHRQALENPIIRISMLAREGDRIPSGLMKLDDEAWVNVVDAKGDKVTFDISREAQVICGTNDTRWGLTTKIRKKLGHKERDIYEGEKLIVCRNSRQHQQLVNGCFVYAGNHVELPEGQDAFGIKLEYAENQFVDVVCDQGLIEENYLRVKGGHTCDRRVSYFSKRRNHHVDYGHVITCHKSQGSQFEEVIVHNEAGVFKNDRDKWLYTAITRAEKRLTIVA